MSVVLVFQYFLVVSLPYCDLDLCRLEYMLSALMDLGSLCHCCIT